MTAVVGFSTLVSCKNQRNSPHSHYSNVKSHNLLPIISYVIIVTCECPLLWRRHNYSTWSASRVSNLTIQPSFCSVCLMEPLAQCNVCILGVTIGVVSSSSLTLYNQTTALKRNRYSLFIKRNERGVFLHIYTLKRIRMLACPAQKRYTRKPHFLFRSIVYCAGKSCIVDIALSNAWFSLFVNLQINLFFIRNWKHLFRNSDHTVEGKNV